MKKGKKRLVINFQKAWLLSVFKEAYHWMPGRKGIAITVTSRPTRVYGEKSHHMARFLTI